MPIPNSDYEKFIGYTFPESHRKAVRAAFAVSAIGYLVAVGNYVPEKIGLLGIEFGDVQKKAFIDVLLAITIYTSVSFFLSAMSAFINIWHSYYDAMLQIDGGIDAEIDVEKGGSVENFHYLKGPPVNFTYSLRYMKVVLAAKIFLQCILPLSVILGVTWMLF